MNYFNYYHYDMKFERTRSWVLHLVPKNPCNVADLGRVVGKIPSGKGPASAG